MPTGADFAVVGGRLLTGLLDLTSDLSALDSQGSWAVVLPFDGVATCARFESCRFVAAASAYAVAAPAAAAPAAATGGAGASWTSSLDRNGYEKGVVAVRESIAAGDVYQVNLCRRLSTPLPVGFDLARFAAALAAGNPAPHGALVSLPAAGVAVASASPERFLRRSGPMVESQPVKGTARAPEGLTAKDRAENVMIVDLVRNDLGRVCEPGSVEVPDLCRVEDHPGLVHMTSTVRGRLRQGVGWPELLAATFPPGSVTGAPKLAALGIISKLEPEPRGVYCGAVGWVDADRSEGDLNVAIRTFWQDEGRLNLGTGAGITWGSTPAGEWAETELKARRLLEIADEGR